MTDLDDDDNFSMNFQTLDEVVGQVCSSSGCLLATTFDGLDPLISTIYASVSLLFKL